MALRVGYGGLSSEGPAEQRLLDAARRIVDSRTARSDGVRTSVSDAFSLYSEQPTQNWSGQGESDCLIKTKHCDGLKRC